LERFLAVHPICALYFSAPDCAVCGWNDPIRCSTVAVDVPVPTIRDYGGRGGTGLPPSALAPISSVIHPVFRSIDGILSFVLSVVGTAVRSITDTVPTLFAKVLLVIDTISGIVDGIMPSLDASADSGGQDDRLRTRETWIGSLCRMPANGRTFEASVNAQTSNPHSSVTQRPLSIGARRAAFG